MVKITVGKETQQMADVHSTVKFSQRAFNQGVSDLITLRPLREALAGLARRRVANSREIVATEANNRTSKVVVLKHNVKKTSGRN